MTGHVLQQRSRIPRFQLHLLLRIQYRAIERFAGRILRRSGQVRAGSADPHDRGLACFGEVETGKEGVYGLGGRVTTVQTDVLFGRLAAD